MESASDIPAGEFIATTPLEAHPVADIMPMMEGEEYQDVKASIQKHGLKNAIVLYEGKILDGRNRYNICMELHIPVRAREWEGGMDPVDYVVSMNIKRRQLTPAARAMCAVKALEYYRIEAAKRKAEAGAANIAKYNEEQSQVLVVAPVPQLEEPAAPAESAPVEKPEAIHPARYRQRGQGVRRIAREGRGHRGGILVTHWSLWPGSGGLRSGMDALVLTS